MVRTVMVLACARWSKPFVEGRAGEDAAGEKGWRCGRGLGGIAVHLCPRCVSEPMPDWWPTEED